MNKVTKTPAGPVLTVTFVYEFCSCEFEEDGEIRQTSVPIDLFAGYLLQQGDVIQLTEFSRGAKDKWREWTLLKGDDSV